MKNLQLLLLTALLIAATEHIGASGKSAQAPRTSLKRNTSSNNIASVQPSQAQNTVTTAQQQLLTRRLQQNAAARKIQNLARQYNQRKAENALTKGIEDGSLVANHADGGPQGVRDYVVTVDGPKQVPNPSYANQIRTNLSAAGKGLYRAGKAVYDAPGSLSKTLGGQQRFITGETGSLRSATNNFGRRFNEGLKMQLAGQNKPNTLKPTVVEGNGNISFAEGKGTLAEAQNKAISKNTELVEAEIFNPEIASASGQPVEAFMVPIETQPIEAQNIKPIEGQQSNNRSYAGRAYDAAKYAGRVVYHTPGATVYGLGASNPNFISGAPKNAVWAAGKIRDAAVATPGAIYNAPGRVAAYATGNPNNQTFMTNAYRRVTNNPRQSERSNFELNDQSYAETSNPLNQTVNTESFDAANLTDLNGSYFGKGAKNQSTKSSSGDTSSEYGDVMF